MPGRKSRQSYLRDPRLAFGVATLAFAAAWFFGISNRAPLASVKIEAVRSSGIASVLTAGVSDMFNTILVLAAAAGCYIICLLALRREFRYRWAFAIAGSIIVAAAALPVMPLTSPDTTHFAADVRTLWLHHQNPTEFSGVPAKQDDPVAREVRTFSGAPSGYGPLAYLIGGVTLPFVGDGLRANVFGQKVLASLMLLATAIAAGLVAKRLGRNPAFATAAVGMNPMFIWQFPGDGHNDAIMAAFGTFALLFLIRRDWPRRGTGAALAAAAVLTKFSLVLAAPVVATAWFPKLRVVIAGVVGIGGVIALVVFFSGVKPEVGTVGPFEGITRNSPWYLLFNGFDLQGRSHDVTLAICYSGALISIALVCLFHRFDTEQDIVDAIALVLALFLFFFAPTLRQWYQIWAFPAVALTSRRWLRHGGFTFSIMGFAPVIALNWQVSLSQQVGLSHPVEVAIVIAWLVTISVAFMRWYRDRPRSARQTPRAHRPSAARSRAKLARAR